MKYRIEENKTKIHLSDDEWPGVIRVAGYVAGDVELVMGFRPEVAILLSTKKNPESGPETEALSPGGKSPESGPEAEALSLDGEIPEAGDGFDLWPGCVYAGTLGRSALIDGLVGSGRLDVSKVKGKREVYSFGLINAGEGEGTALVIAGSDKRGTIYGLFHLSELMGVSPWTWFADVAPAHRDEVTITEAEDVVSREPSVKYRGFFINDEWPSFGNWTFEHFGGFTAGMYEHVFELLLRLKANYLWPAMWSSNFSCDGPGLKNAELADEMGIVMSSSHHEPCLRHSEEWDLVKGDDTPYGSAWNFDRNREGLINYWREGLERNGRFENVITVGMRGERDSEILGREATLRENIDYLKDVITAQNDLIRETIGPDLDGIPRMLAIYKEVERYYYGDADNEGLRTWDGLNGITCMLCEDNFGNMRGLPERSEIGRRGGFGMYYHFDYHGDPVSYEWVCSTHLAKVWEQMTLCYESGVREIWIVNVGDLKPQELPISYFMDLAYDYDKWGLSNGDSALQYLHKWVVDQFGPDDAGMIITLLNEYTRINSMRKPESLRSDTYHPFCFGESAFMSGLADTLVNRARETEKRFEGTPLHDAYRELVGFPVEASMNVLKMQLAAGRNEMLSRQGRTTANRYADVIEECIAEDERLTRGYHELAGGKWNGMMLSRHVGFRHWNDEECAYPVISRVVPARRHCMVVADPNGEFCTQGGDWTRKTLYLTGFTSPSVTVQDVAMENAGTGSFRWEVTGGNEWLRVSPSSGTLEPDETVEVRILLDAAGLEKNVPRGEMLIPELIVKSEFAHAVVAVACVSFDAADRAMKHYVPVLPEGGASEAELRGLREHVDAQRSYTGADDLTAIIDAHEFECGEGYRIMYGYGKYGSGLRSYPVTAGFDPDETGAVMPTARVQAYAPEAGEYLIGVISAPSNPIDAGGRLRVGVRANDDPMQTACLVGSDYHGGAPGCGEWAAGVLNNEHRSYVPVSLKQGVNEITLCAIDPAVIVERILIKKK